jgi:hypothetical protein
MVVLPQQRSQLLHAGLARSLQRRVSEQEGEREGLLLEIIFIATFTQRFFGTK